MTFLSELTDIDCLAGLLHWTKDNITLLIHYYDYIIAHVLTLIKSMIFLLNADREHDFVFFRFLTF